MPDETINVLIADDEPLGRDLLRHMLVAHADVHVVAECADGESALAAIKHHTPVLVFLDIQMPKLDGLRLLDGLDPAARPFVVFVTAHDRYALEAFEGQAFDYLLKPFDQERFDRTLARVRQQITQQREARIGKTVAHLFAKGGGSSRPADERIVIRESGRVSFVEIAEIEWLEASGNYVTLHVGNGGKHLVHETMARLETRLDPARFLRIHRSTIVRIDRIKELLPHFNGEFVVVLKDNMRLKLSRSYVESARVALGLG
jgi:two-component system, LytTR family, response regulator